MVDFRDSAQVRAMMRAYEGPKHTVVGFDLQSREVEVFGSGPIPAEADYDQAIFEIGSITKVFTGILLCLFVEEGEIDPHAPLCEASDELSFVPRWITPESLATHTSGLPRIHVPIWKALLWPLPADPYADFSRSDLLNWLRVWSNTATEPKRRHAYSNLGFGLLGEAMALRAGKSFAALIRERVIEPLGLKDTSAGQNECTDSRFMSPRNTKGEVVSAWTFEAIAGAGCLRSSARDLEQFSKHVIGALKSPASDLDRAIVRSAKPAFGLGPRNAKEPAAQCYGWLSMKFDPNGPRFLYHDGGTGGATSAIYVCPEKEAAVAILSNNGIAASLWASTKLSWSGQFSKAQSHFSAL